MEKPIVFLSHSSRDKESLVALKKILDDRAAGSLNFFLSSDGESIRLGRNWVVGVSDALAQCKVMFVFLTAQSADSKWIHFEAGYAYARGILVVPVCFPGIDLNGITPPLNLLQGFNLHQNESMGNLARVCNETFDMKIDEAFGKDDFNSVVGNLLRNSTGFFGSQGWAVDQISLWAGGPSEDHYRNPFPALEDICTRNDMKCFASEQKAPLIGFNQQETLTAELELPGCRGIFKMYESRARITEPSLKKYELHFTASPALFHVNAPLLDIWTKGALIPFEIHGKIQFNGHIKLTNKRHDLTTKLYQCGVELLGLEDNSGFSFNGLVFDLSTYNKIVSLSYKVIDKVADERVPILIEKLFTAQVLWKHQPDLSEIFDNTGY